MHIDIEDLPELATPVGVHGSGGSGAFSADIVLAIAIAVATHGG
jgi:hypothetical protein